jgi:hypothetical protein
MAIQSHHVRHRGPENLAIVVSHEPRPARAHVSPVRLRLDQSELSGVTGLLVGAGVSARVSFVITSFGTYVASNEPRQVARLEFWSG